MVVAVNRRSQAFLRETPFRLRHEWQDGADDDSLVTSLHERQWWLNVLIADQQKNLSQESENRG